jgi:hypothetical protein
MSWTKLNHASLLDTLGFPCKNYRRENMYFKDNSNTDSNQKWGKKADTPSSLFLKLSQYAL